MLSKDKSCMLTTAMPLHIELCNVQGEGGKQDGKEE